MCCLLLLTIATHGGNGTRPWAKKVKKLFFFCGNVAVYQNPEMRLTNKGWGWWWYGWCYGNNNKVLMLYICSVVAEFVCLFFSLYFLGASFSTLYFIFFFLWRMGEKKRIFFLKKDIYFFSLSSLKIKILTQLQTVQSAFLFIVAFFYLLFL